MVERKTVVGVFSDRTKAQEVIAELKRAGFRDDQIGLTSGGTHGDTDSSDAKGNYAGEGGVAGVATGAGLGALWGLGILAGVLPAIGPAIAGGTLAVLLSSAAAGAAAAGLAGTLVGLGIPKEEAEFYEGEVKAGRTIVTVNANGRNAEALAILRRFGGYDMSSRGEGSMTSALGTSASGTSALKDQSQAACAATLKGGDQRTIQAKEEKLEVRKHKEQTGSVTVRKEVHTEHKTLEVPVEREEVVIERHAVSGKTASGSIGKSEEIRIPVSEEHVHIEKTPVVTEEVTVGKRKVKDSERVGATVRKEEIKVDKVGNPDTCDR